MEEVPRPRPARSWRDRDWRAVVDALRRPDAPERRRALLVVVPVVVATVAVAAVAIRWLLATPAPPPELTLPRADGAPVASGAPATAAATDPLPDVPLPDVVVHVAGAVARPGLYRVVAEARVADAIEAAGGSAAGADLDRINLAATVSDGEQVYVPRMGEPIPAAGSEPGSESGPVDLNTADIDQLDRLPGIGPATAAAIVAHRDQHGPFASVDGLLEVRGIGPAKLEALRDLVTV